MAGMYSEFQLRETPFFHSEKLCGFFSFRFFNRRERKGTSDLRVVL